MKMWNFLTKREWYILSRERAILLIVLIAPVLYLFFYGSIYVHNTVTKAEIAVIDRDQSEFSRLYRQYLEADPVLVTQPINDVDEAQRLLEEQKIAGYLILPSHLEKDVKQGKQVVIPAYINTGSFILGNELNKRFLQINQTLSTGILLKTWEARGLNPKTALQQSMPVTVDISPVGNFGYGYGSFLLVGLFLLILHQLMLISISESTALEFEKNTVGEWYE
ncbi:MAG TPA: ABC transporter permease, partial [Candidatus Cloacimonadota bacterium]|nr:ABC transporter permease [Candidatus Cloacimonadota bacterium]